jgi:hypothetical protein
VMVEEGIWLFWCVDKQASVSAVTLSGFRGIMITLLGSFSLQRQ